MQFTVDDFSTKPGRGTQTLYLNKNCAIFNKDCTKDTIFLIVHTETVYTRANSTEKAAKEEINNYISKISEYINWLAGKCKKDLIKYYNEYYKRKNGKEWYKSLEIHIVGFIIEKEGKMTVTIVCKDMYCEHDILQIEMDNEKKVRDLFYLYYENGEHKRYWDLEEKGDPWYKELLEYPNGGKIYVLRSVNYYDIGEYNKALGAIDKAIEIDECAINYYLRSKIHYDLEQYEKSLEDINEAINQKPDWVDAREHRIRILLTLGRNEEALEDANMTIKLKPDSFFFYMRRGEIYEQQGEYKKAMDDYEYVANNANDNYYDKICKYELIKNLNKKMKSMENA